MSDVRFTKDHEWVRVEGDTATVGISEYAQEQLGDVVFVELPEVGRQFVAKDEAAVVESVKAASEIYAPVAGEVRELYERACEEGRSINAVAEAAGVCPQSVYSYQARHGLPLPNRQPAWRNASVAVSGRRVVQ